MLDLVDEPGIKDAYSVKDVNSGGDAKDAFFEKSGDFSLTRCLVVDVVL
jgi:hypothetical protein